jgi:hypothetical protein
MSHAAALDELLKVPGDELRAIVRDNARPLAGELFATMLDDRLHLGFLHVRADLPVNDELAVPVEDAVKEEESPTDIDVGNIDVPVLISWRWLLEATPLLGRLSPAGTESAGHLEDAIGTGRTDGHDVRVDHHGRKPSMTFQGVAVTERQDRDLLPLFQPEVAWDGHIVLVGYPGSLALAVKLAQGDSQPPNQQDN